MSLVLGHGSERRQRVDDDHVDGPVGRELDDVVLRRLHVRGLEAHDALQVAACRHRPRLDERLAGDPQHREVRVERLVGGDQLEHEARLARAELADDLRRLAGGETAAEHQVEADGAGRQARQHLAVDATHDGTLTVLLAHLLQQLVDGEVLDLLGLLGDDRHH